MALWGYEYAHLQSGGSMDFWDGLDASRKRMCVDVVDGILAAIDDAGRASLSTRNGGGEE